jgi:hypothetical protein
VAEVQKAKGAALAIAVAPGRYQVLVRGATELLRCTAAPGASPITVSLDGCKREALIENQSKGGGLGPRWQMTATVGVGGGRTDGYVQRLQDFGYHRQTLGSPQIGVSLTERLHRHVQVGGEVLLIGGERWERDSGAMPLELTWDTLGFGGVGRVETRRRWIVGYAQLGAGLALGFTSFRDQLGATEKQTFPGIYGAAALGADAWFTRRWGMTLRLTGSYAPAIDNLLGDQHDGGLITIGLGAVTRR